jgi:hypothetical protein
VDSDPLIPPAENEAEDFARKSLAVLLVALDEARKERDEAWRDVQDLTSELYDVAGERDRLAAVAEAAKAYRQAQRNKHLTKTDEYERTRLDAALASMEGGGE